MIHFKILLFIISAISITSAKPINEKNTVIKLLPYSDSLTSDVEICKIKACTPIYGTIREVLSFKNEEVDKATIIIDFEFCSVKVDASYIALKNNRLILQANDKDEAEVRCNEITNTYKRIALLNYDGQSGVSLRKLESSFSHLGKLQAGIIFLPILKIN